MISLDMTLEWNYWKNKEKSQKHFGLVVGLNDMFESWWIYRI